MDYGWCRPLSKRKCWQVTEILHRAKVFDADTAAREAAKQERLHAQHSSPSFAAAGIVHE